MFGWKKRQKSAVVRRARRQSARHMYLPQDTADPSRTRQGGNRVSDDLESVDTAQFHHQRPNVTATNPRDPDFWTSPSSPSRDSPSPRRRQSPDSLDRRRDSSAGSLPGFGWFSNNHDISRPATPTSLDDHHDPHDFRAFQRLPRGRLQSPSSHTPDTTIRRQHNGTLNSHDTDGDTGGESIYNRAPNSRMPALPRLVAADVHNQVQKQAVLGTRVPYLSNDSHGANSHEDFNDVIDDMDRFLDRWDQGSEPARQTVLGTRVPYLTDDNERADIGGDDRLQNTYNRQDSRDRYSNNNINNANANVVDIPPNQIPLPPLPPLVIPRIADQYDHLPTQRNVHYFRNQQTVGIRNLRSQLKKRNRSNSGNRHLHSGGNTPLISSSTDSNWILRRAADSDITTDEQIEHHGNDRMIETHYDYPPVPPTNQHNPVYDHLPTEVGNSQARSVDQYNNRPVAEDPDYYQERQVHDPDYYQSRIVRDSRHAPFYPTGIYASHIETGQTLNTHDNTPQWTELDGAGYRFNSPSQMQVVARSFGDGSPARSPHHEAPYDYSNRIHTHLSTHIGKQMSRSADSAMPEGYHSMNDDRFGSQERLVPTTSRSQRRRREGRTSTPYDPPYTYQRNIDATPRPGRRLRKTLPRTPDTRDDDEVPEQTTGRPWWVKQSQGLPRPLRRQPSMTHHEAVPSDAPPLVRHQQFPHPRIVPHARLQTRQNVPLSRRPHVPSRATKPNHLMALPHGPMRAGAADGAESSVSGPSYQSDTTSRLYLLRHPQRHPSTAGAATGLGGSLNYTDKSVVRRLFGLPRRAHSVHERGGSCPKNNLWFLCVPILAVIIVCVVTLGVFLSYPDDKADVIEQVVQAKLHFGNMPYIRGYSIKGSDDFNNAENEFCNSMKADFQQTLQLCQIAKISEGSVVIHAVMGMVKKMDPAEIVNRLQNTEYAQSNGLNSEVVIEEASGTGACREGACVNGGTCVEDELVYRCACPAGYTGTACEQDVDECSLGEHGCAQRCENSPPGTYTCLCGPGYTVVGKDCIDVDECAAEEARAPCEHTCTNTVGSYECGCDEGFMLAEDGAGCVDINECIRCEQLCENTPGSFTCSCRSGYRLGADRTSCLDILECEETPDLCSQLCVDTPGTYACSCRAGYALDEQDGSTCHEVDECLDNPCSHDCFNTPGSYLCFCPIGYTLLPDDANTCKDTDECLGSPCEHTCTNTPGSFTCGCNPGYTLALDRRTCQDVDECVGSHGCSQICQNSIGSFECTCQPGYKLDEDRITCRDVDECMEGSPCEFYCDNTEGSFSCRCQHGYTLNSDGRSCDDINECSGELHGCQHRCNNIVGSYMCTCNTGYVLRPDGRRCRDVDECQDNHGCMHSCENTAGSFICHCNSGYDLASDGKTCTDVDECQDNHGCMHSCENTAGSFICRCNSGYDLATDGKTCTEIATTTTALSDPNELMCEKCSQNQYFCRGDQQQYYFKCTGLGKYVRMPCKSPSYCFLEDADFCINTKPCQ